MIERLRLVPAALLSAAGLSCAAWPPPDTARALRGNARTADAIVEAFVPVLEGTAVIESWTPLERAAWADRLEANALRAQALAGWTVDDAEDRGPDDDHR